MSTGSTAKGEQRRRRIVDAAVELFHENGLSAVRHRAVADRAGVPLSATTYYFSSIDDLIAQVIERSSLYEHERMQGLVDGVTMRHRGTEATADLLVDLFITPEGAVDRNALIARGERVVGSARAESLRKLQQGLAGPYSRMLAEVLRKSKRRTTPAGMTHLTALINGTVMIGLLDESADLCKMTRAALLPVLDVYAPPVGGPQGARAGHA